MDKLWVINIFESVQGEGFHTGRVAIFIRFAGCNLRCSFCDTKFAWDKEEGRPLDPWQIMTAIETHNYKSKFVVLTGGEPLVQDFNALQELIEILQGNNYYVAMESNGSIEFNKRDLGLDWVTISPKTILWRGQGDELKLLYDGTQELIFYEQGEFAHYYLQPILPEDNFVFDKEENIMKVLKAFEKVLVAVKENPKWKVSFQAHKLVGII